MGFCLPRIVNAKRVLRASTDVPKGYFPVYVGENQKRFVIPVSYLNSPLFQDLLSLSEEEFGYDHPSGALRIPCGEVEAKAAVHPLMFAADLGLQHIELEGDALFIVCKLNSTASDLSVMRPLTEEAKQLVNSFRSHTVMHVRRSGNTAPAAHLAKFGLNCNEPCFWIEECPDNIRNVVKSDMVHSH